jgi:hypothetical protein
MKITAPIIAAALARPRTDIDRLLANKHFVPVDVGTAQPTRGRDWSKQDLVRLVTLLRLIDCGVSPTVGQAIGRLHAYRDARTFAMVHAYSSNLLLAAVPGESTDSGSPYAVFSIHQDELLEYLTPPFEPVAVFLVPLDEVERDVDRIFEMAEVLEQAGV